MPSINEVIERQMRLRPDAFSDDTKAQWLLELDGKLKAEVILRHKVTNGTAYTGKVHTCPVCGEEQELEYNNKLDMTRCKCGWDNGVQIPQEYPKDGDMQLMVSAPYDNLYDLYLFAQADLYNRDNDAYNDSVTVFEQAKHEWQRAWHKNHLPTGDMVEDAWQKVVV